MITQESLCKAGGSFLLIPVTVYRAAIIGMLIHVTIQRAAKLTIKMGDSI